MSAAKEPEWKRLQRRVFSRWINMKLRLGRSDVTIKEDELVTCWGTGYTLVRLLEVLSGQQFGKPLKKEVNMRVQKVDQCNRALTFAWQVGTQIELKPSAENLIDGEERQVMGLIWGIMRSFLNFGDDESMSIQDALLLWVNNQVGEYGLKARNFGKDWHDGKIFCALIHKYRPDLIGDFPPSGSDLDNIKLGMDGAEKFFGLEQYLEPADILVLDDKSMIIYVAEWYYGITGFRKQYLAADRIAKGIALSRRNNELKNEYNEKARRLRAGLTEAEELMRASAEVDNTLQGARNRLQEFDRFKRQLKGGLVDDFLSCERLFSEISMRLADQGRPEFRPDAGLSIPELRAAFTELEAEEKRRVVALHAELARQERLHKLGKQHATRAGLITGWGQQKQAELAEDGQLNSVGEASFALTLLQAHEDEARQVRESNLVQLQQLGQELAGEQFELQAEVEAREAEAVALLDELEAAAAAKRERLVAALEREKRFEQLRQAWAVAVNDLVRWTADQAADVPSAVFGETLAQLESYDLAAADAQLRAEQAKRRSRFDAAQAALEEAGIAGQANGYTQRTLGDVEAAEQALDAAVEGRAARYAEERERLARNDQLCAAFAQVAEALAEEVNASKDAINNAQGEVEAQLELVQAAAAKAEAEAPEKLSAVKEAAAALEAAGVTGVNPHTLLAEADVETIWAQYQAFLALKGQMVADAIQHKRLRGVSPETFAEIRANFRNFDKDNSGTIDADELKQALYSLGENKSKEDIAAILKEFGDGNTVNEEGFTDYMISVVGANTSKQGLLDAFYEISKGADSLNPEDQMHCFSPEQKAHILETAPRTEDGRVDFRAWVEAEFAQ